ncbi:MAG: hypothetical protein AAF587_07505 [Bacteroidota bacterium]
MYRLIYALCTAALLSLYPFALLHGQIGSKLSTKVKLPKPFAASSTHASPPSSPELDFSSSRFMPAITMESLLSGGIHLTIDGKLTTKGLSVAFLPPKTTTGEPANYDSYKKQDLLLRADLVDLNTKEVVGQFHYSVNPVMKIASVMNQKPVEGSDFFLHIGQGNFRLDFFAANTHFYTFSFEVIKKENDDPYAAFSECLFLKGPWEAWNYIDFDAYHEHELVVWHHFMDNPTTNIENAFRVEKNCDYKFRYELLRNGKLFGAHDSRMNGSKRGSYHLKKEYAAGGSSRTKWINSSVQISKIPGNNPDVWEKLRRSDFTDATYEMIVYTVDCAGEEKKRSFPFRVSKGKFVMHPEQNRSSHQDHRTIIEGGPHQFWYKKK